MSARENRVMDRLNDQKLARLDEMRGDEERAVYLRRLLHEPPRDTEVATHGEAMVIVTRSARDGRTTAATGQRQSSRPSSANSSRLWDCARWREATLNISRAAMAASHGATPLITRERCGPGSLARSSTRGSM